MKNNAIKVHNLETLRAEKMRLKAFCTYQGKLLEYKWEYLKENYPQLISKELLPFDEEKNNLVSRILDTINDFILSLFPAGIRENKVIGAALRLMQVFIIRAFEQPKKASS
jgi:hypothetical protein